jgi:hypothetical protein
MVHPGTLFHRRQRGIPMHSYENRSEIRALQSAALSRSKRHRTALIELFERTSGSELQLLGCPDDCSSCSGAAIVQ